MPRVVVTRPAAQALEWVRRLEAAGIAAVALPLIEIAAAPDRAALATAWAGLATRDLVVFASPNAVLHFFAAMPAGRRWPASVDAAAPGPGTADALRDCGVDGAHVIEPAADSAQFDSESLWRRLEGRDWRAKRVLVVRGDGGREWLAEQLTDAGAAVDAVGSYRRAAPVFAGADRGLLEVLARDPGVVWLFTSSQAIGHLEAAAGAGRWGGATAIATHPRVAARARAAGFGRVVEAGPGLPALVACIQSIGP